MQEDLEANRLISKRQAHFKKRMAQKLAMGAAGLVITLSPATGGAIGSGHGAVPARDISNRLAEAQSSWLLHEGNATQESAGAKNKKAERLVRWQNGWDDWRNR